jgi:hypothetical protein
VEPDPLVITVRERFLFCITGTETGFEVMSESESRTMSKSLHGSPEALRRAPLAKPDQQPVD